MFRERSADNIITTGLMFGWTASPWLRQNTLIDTPPARLPLFSNLSTSIKLSEIGRRNETFSVTNFANYHIFIEEIRK